MAFLGGLLGGGSDPADIYGDLFTEKQRAALRDQQLTDTLLRLSAGFAKAGQASRLPTGGLLGAIGEAAGGLAGTGDEATNRMLKGMQIAEQVRQSQQERAILAKAAPYVEAIMKRFNLDRGTATQVAAQMAGGAGGAPPGGPPGSSAPPPPPAYRNPDMGDAPARLMPSPSVSETGDTRMGLPPAGMSPFGLPPGDKQAGLLPPPQDDPWAQYAGLLGGGTGSQSPFDPTTLDPTGPRGSPDRRIQIEQLSGTAAPAGEDARLSRLMQVETFPKPATAAHINYGGTGALGNPAEAGWRNSNIVPVPAPGGARFDVHRAAAPDFAGFLQDLSALGYKIDPKTSSSYNYRNIRGSDQLSEHAYGTAIDINSNANLYTRDGKRVTNLPSEVGQLAAQHNLEWGGNWKDPVDTMHFQWRGPGAASDRGAPPADDSLTRLSQLMQVQTTAPAPADSRLAALTRRYESGDRNIMQQVNATGTAGGYYQITDPTWRDIAPKAGIDLEKYPTAISAPREVQDAAASALRQTRGMQPWSSNRPLMAAIGDSGFSGRIEPLGSDAAPAGTGGEIPGLGVRPEALAALNAMLKMGGIKSDPFGSLLETYYKSPGYLEEKARTEEAARKKVGLEYDPLIAAQTEIAKSKVELEYKPKIEEAVQKLQSPILKERAQGQADIDRISEELKRNRDAALTPTDATIAGPDGQPVDTKISAMDLVLKQKDRADRIAKGDLAIRPGDIIGKPSLSPEQTAAQTERGKAPYTTGDITLTWPDGETRKVTVTGEQRKDVLEGRPVPAIGWPGTTGGGTQDGASAAAGGGRIGDVVYPPGYAEATTVMLKERRPKAEAAVQSLNFNDTATRLLDAGIISGWGASLRLDAAKAKSLLGWSDDRIANTETFLATQARQVAASLASGAFGSGSSITENDREYAANMVGANSNLDEKSLRFLVRTNRTAANWEIDRYKADVERHDPKGRLPILRVQEPTRAEAKPSANQPTPIGQSKIGDKSYVKWSDGQWRPEGELPGEEKR